MNKKYVLNELKNKLNLDDDKISKIGEIGEKYSIVGKKNKKAMVEAFITELKVTNEEAEIYYETLSSIIISGIKEKIKHPFKKAK